MGRDLSLERAWRERMRQYERSGLTVREFCEQAGLVDHQFSWWRAELRRRSTESRAADERGKKSKQPSPTKRSAKPAKAAATSFLPLEVEESVPTQSSIEIVLDQPPRIRVTPGFDAAVLREVVRVLEQH